MTIAAFLMAAPALALTPDDRLYYRRLHPIRTPLNVLDRRPRQGSRGDADAARP